MGKPLYCGIPFASARRRTEQRKHRSKGPVQPAMNGGDAGARQDRSVRPALGRARSFSPVPRIFQWQRGSLREACIPSLSFRGVEITRVLVSGEGTLWVLKLF